MADVLYFGAAPGFASLNQINVRAPEVVPGSNRVPVRLHYLGRSAARLASAALMNPNHQLTRHLPEAALAIEAFVPA